eukprot:scaffold111129_cov19-Tisochrysis_lutea.AAC.1
MASTIARKGAWAARSLIALQVDHYAHKSGQSAWCRRGGASCVLEIGSQHDTAIVSVYQEGGQHST